MIAERRKKRQKCKQCGPCQRCCYQMANNRQGRTSNFKKQCMKRKAACGSAIRACCNALANAFCKTRTCRCLCCNDHHKSSLKCQREFDREDFMEKEIDEFCINYKYYTVQFFNFLILFATLFNLLVIFMVPYRGQELIQMRPASSQIFDQVYEQWELQPFVEIEVVNSTANCSVGYENVFTRQFFGSMPACNCNPSYVRSDQ